jgi:hypothetical protein
VSAAAQGLTQVELYPFPIPDVFVGQPLLVSGKFEGDWPETVEICGTLPDGNSEWECYSCCYISVVTCYHGEVGQWQV